MLFVCVGWCVLLCMFSGVRVVCVVEERCVVVLCVVLWGVRGVVLLCCCCGYRLEPSPCACIIHQYKQPPHTQYLNISQAVVSFCHTTAKKTTLCRSSHMCDGCGRKRCNVYIYIYVDMP